MAKKWIGAQTTNLFYYIREINCFHKDRVVISESLQTSLSNTAHFSLQLQMIYNTFEQFFKLRCKSNFFDVECIFCELVAG